jgi:hypothetical protein
MVKGRFSRAAGSLTLVAAAFLVYWAALDAYFFEDDFQWLVSRWTFHPSHLIAISGQSHFYRPVVELYFWIASPLFDGSPRLFHLANVLLHIANAGIVYLVGAAIGLRRPFAWVAALLFVVQPGHVAAIAWVGALAEAIGLLFGGTSLLALLRYRHTGGARWLTVSAAAFALALFTHESSVVFLPLLVLADMTAGRWSWRAKDIARAYAPYLLLTAVYLAVDLTINARHYLIAEGQYRLGLHMIRNVFEYIASLYVGERVLAAHVAVAGVLGWILWRGSARARFAAAWMILAMAPFLPLTFGNVSRYLYLPAAGFALLLAEGLSVLDGRLTGRLGPSARRVVLVVIILFVAGRFANFARRGVADVAARAEMYRTFVTDLRQTHPTLPDHSVVPVDAEAEKRMPLRFLEAAVRWEYRNPTLKVEVKSR